MYSNPSEVIIKLLSTNSRKDKEAILEDAMREDSVASDIFVAGAMRALDTFETFGIKKVPVMKSFCGGNDLLSTDWYVFKDLLDKLASRELTGNDAIEAVQQVAEGVNTCDWNGFYNRVLAKNLDCGVNVTTWNKVAAKVDSHFIVDVFSCQLATDSSKAKDLPDTAIVEVKLDGVRVITHVPARGPVRMYSRNGKELTNFPNIIEQFTKLQAGRIQEDMIFDGEVMSSSFQDLMKQVHRKDDVQTDDAILYLFDMIPYDKFKSGLDMCDQGIRSGILLNYIAAAKEKLDLPNIDTVRYDILELNTELGQDKLEKINRAAIHGGYEGIMIKDINAPYQTKRTKSWLKMKPYIEVTLEVIDIEEGTGKYVESTGALVCRGTDTGREICVNVGSGLTDDTRNDLWVNKSNIVGQLVEVRADAITQNQDGTYSLRFPRFKSFRGFTPGEKI